MSERNVIERGDGPISAGRIADDCSQLGVEPGDTLLVHSSLSALGWVAGGAAAVVDALMETVTDAGTLVMPTHTGHYSDPDRWEDPPVPDDWTADVRATIPPFRPEVTPTRGMGAIPECFRTYPGVVRSRHPTTSFAAWGADAGFVVGDHAYDDGLGERSPLARVYDLDGSVLLLGVGHDTNTSLHLAEHRADFEKTVVTQGAPVLASDRREEGREEGREEERREGRDEERGEGDARTDRDRRATGAPVAPDEREWISFEELDYDDGDFERAGAAFERDRPDATARGRVGNAEAVVLSQRALVDYAVGWFGENRA
ncbi:AAC(3) family N-acetyltransferase [Halorussus salilacus]|uniref:aminoglycoside N(3)-acetyltransferase n=1 Tax=Halorussus salilacus TaxID=2953750 RepID=UPI00209E299A|nr:AAC(3) family N-acetyltransferase [Halorussus salilacus]USZ68984.1 AAC(3) family N-acetyltransferase [Halorussus salilacus]